MKWRGGTNLGKVLVIESDKYSLKPIDAHIRETIANALDDQKCGASKVDIRTKLLDKWTLLLSIADNGCGMQNFEVLKEYHKYGSDSKVKTFGDIGFVGVGSCVYIAHAKCQYTETKHKNGFHKRVRWHFDKDIGDTICELVLETNEIETPSGTIITVEVVNKEDIELLTDDSFIIDVVRSHFNTVLLGLHGDKKIFVNGKQVEPFLPKEKQHRIREFTISDQQPLQGKKYKTMFYLTEESLPEFWNCHSIVVGKQIVLRTTDFIKQPLGDMRDRMYGYVIGDGLITIINQAKDNFNRKTSLWKEFEKKVTKEWIAFLDQLGVGEAEHLADKTLVKYEAKLNELMNTPKWSKIKDLLFSKIETDKEPVRTQCPQCGTENIHTWAKDNTMYECKDGHHFPKKYTFKKIGHTDVDISTILKKPKTEWKTSYYNEEKDYVEARFSPPQSIAINMGREPFKIAKKTDGMKDLHIRRCIAFVLYNELKAKGKTDSDDLKEFFELFKDLGGM